MPVLFVVGVGVVILVAVLAYLAEKRRRELLQGVAASRGWHYTRRDDAWARRFDGSPFGQGHNRQAHNILRGLHDGRDFVGFDFVYHTTETSSDGKGHTTSREVAHSYSVLALRTADSLPRLEVSPENFFGRALGKLTNRDIQLESEEFNRAFTVVSSDRRFAYDILHPRSSTGPTPPPPDIPSRRRSAAPSTSSSPWRRPTRTSRPAPTSCTCRLS